jgi:hypothetical protein
VSSALFYTPLVLLPEPFLSQSAPEINSVCPGKHMPSYIQDRVGNVHNKINCEVSYIIDLRYPHNTLLIS